MLGVESAVAGTSEAAKALEEMVEEDGGPVAGATDTNWLGSLC